MTALVSERIDASAGTAAIAAVIDGLSPGANQRIGSFTIGTSVRFYKYAVA